MFKSQIAQRTLAYAIDQNGLSGRVGVRLQYNTEDPYVVFVSFEDDTDTCTWEIDRGLLATGLDRPVGIGDVRVNPESGGGGYWIKLRLTPNEGEATVWIKRQIMSRFLEATKRLVPFGYESRQYVNLDEEIGRLLSGGR